MSEPVVVALITATSVVLVGVLALVGRVSFQITRVRRDTEVTREQVANDHDTNLRVEQDERHDENAQKLDAILEEVQHLRGSVRKLWERSDRHTDQIHDLELTGPRPPFSPPPGGRHRKEIP